jgi:hypothetical protein
MRSAKAASYLAKIIENPSLAPTERPRYVRSFDFLPKSPERTKALVELATAGKVADDIAREALVRLKGTDLNANPEVAAALKSATDKAHGTPQFIELVRDFGLKGQGSALLDTAIKLRGDPSVADAVRLIPRRARCGQDHYRRTRIRARGRHAESPRLDRHSPRPRAPLRAGPRRKAER